MTEEAAAWAAGSKTVAGTDEAGAGPLAGPVVAAAVVLDPLRVPDGLDDSKKLTPRRRATLFHEILASAHVAVASVSAREIDRTDVRKARLLAMSRAVAALPVKADHVLVDGDAMPFLPCPATCLVHGDAKSLSVAAASIVAKESRDAMMRTACAAWPGYGFSRHAGYGTRQHLEALARLGPCPIHRMSFAPLRAD